VTVPLLASCVESAAPVMSPPLAAIVKSVGSINQLPLCPPGPSAALVVITALSAILTLAALVFNKAAIAAVGRRRIERAAHIDGAVAHVAHQQDKRPALF
jgi:hypothetical protein